MGKFFKMLIWDLLQSHINKNKFFFFHLFHRKRVYLIYRFYRQNYLKVRHFVLYFATAAFSANDECLVTGGLSTII